MQRWQPADHWKADDNDIEDWGKWKAPADDWRKGTWKDPYVVLGQAAAMVTTVPTVPAITAATVAKPSAMVPIVPAAVAFHPKPPQPAVLAHKTKAQPAVQPAVPALKPKEPTGPPPAKALVPPAFVAAPKPTVLIKAAPLAAGVEAAFAMFTKVRFSNILLFLFAPCDFCSLLHV